MNKQPVEKMTLQEIASEWLSFAPELRKNMALSEVMDQVCVEILTKQ